ncbi:hypothetical protein B7Z00_04530 [Candidatus Saccharibacteria bacterium 32-50-10]|nr:MAG: hypothetical protein B7Z00_04530 [Candidatus Saccharibacteria bacterium 32-50-10]
MTVWTVITDILSSPYIIAAAIAWISAQVTKYVVASARAKNFRQFKHLYVSGNMPSAHSATVTSLTTMVGLIDGFDSPLFAIALTFAAVVMYDAVMVRRASGEQGAALVQLFGELKSKIALPRVAKGHTPAEVLAGSLLGLVIGLIVFFVIL